MGELPVEIKGSIQQIAEKVSSVAKILSVFQSADRCAFYSSECISKAPTASHRLI
jgi:hypothetical protein